ncbi:MAG: hypothetical protein FWD68_04475 [Alphaproteobacteria bacterium]|nr:hypothetical protein [Alphaproteobacteria bacterium]
MPGGIVLPSPEDVARTIRSAGLVGLYARHILKSYESRAAAQQHRANFQLSEIVL